MTDKSEIEKLLEDAVSQDKKVAPEAQRKIAAILSEPLIMRGYEDDEGVDMGL